MATVRAAMRRCVCGQVSEMSAGITRWSDVRPRLLLVVLSVVMANCALSLATDVDYTHHGDEFDDNIDMTSVQDSAYEDSDVMPGSSFTVLAPHGWN